MTLNWKQLRHSLTNDDWDGTRFVYDHNGDVLVNCSVEDCQHYFRIDPDTRAALFTCHEHAVAIDGPHGVRA